MSHPRQEGVSRLSPPRVVQLPERWVAVVQHHGSPDTVAAARRPLYRHMVQAELVGGPSILRWLDPPVGDRIVDALVITHAGFDGDEACHVEMLPAGPHAVADYEGPGHGLPEAHGVLRSWAASHGHAAAGPLLQVHLMDEVDGVTEQQLQVPLTAHRRLKASAAARP